MDIIFWFATIVFFATYAIIASEKVHKTTAALAGAMLMMLFVLKGPSHGNHDDKHQKEEAKTQEVSSHKTKEIIEDKSIVSHETELKNIIIAKSKKYENLDVFAKYVNFDVIFTLAGMMLLVNVLSGTGLFQYVAIKCAKIAKGSPIATLLMLVIATAMLSAFLDNVTTILLIIPVTLLVASELGVSPIPFLMAETISSNIGGTATLIGDPPNLIIGSIAKLDFAAFLINLAPFIILVLAVYCFCLYYFYRNKMNVTVERRARIMELDEKEAITDYPNMKRGGAVMILTIIGFLIHGAVGLQPCVVAMAGAALALVVCKIDVDHALEKIEWSTLLFFLGLFVLVSGADQAGLMDKFGQLLAMTETWHPLVTILVVMWVSGIAAAIMNNVSFTAAMVAIVAAFLATVGEFKGNIELQHLMWWGLALSVCLGGNGTLVGAAANLVTVGIAEKNGIKISFMQFFKYGVPVTFATLIFASIYIIARFHIVID